MPRTGSIMRPNSPQWLAALRKEAIQCAGKDGTIMALSINGSVDAAKRMEFKSYMCLICGWIYDEEAGLPEEGIAPGTKWEDVPVNWTCPECGARKEDFEMVQI